MRPDLAAAGSGQAGAGSGQTGSAGSGQTGSAGVYKAGRQAGRESRVSSQWGVSQWSRARVVVVAVTNKIYVTCCWSDWYNITAIVSLPVPK